MNLLAVSQKNIVLTLKYVEHVSIEVLMQPVQNCFCRAVLIQGFVATSTFDAYHISLLFKGIIA